MSGAEPIPPVRPDDWDALLHAMLDGTLNDDGRARLSAAIAADQALAREAARAALLHDAIERELVAGAVGRRTARHVTVLARFRRLAVAATLVAAAGVAAWLSLRTTPVADAGQVLARVAAAATAGDRTFRISALDEGRAPARDDRANAGRGGRAKPPIDGALLALRGDDQWVIVRTAEDGATTVTGSDGRTSWNVPSRGAVRTSRDPSRFRGALPGSRHDLPFIDVPGGLAALSQAYRLSFGTPETIDGRVANCVRGTRRAGASGGPRDVAVWYDPATFEVLRMRFDHLPQAQGGPRAVSLELVPGKPLAADFFRHDAHHGADRTVVAED
jgi:hypothetical protein